MMFTDIVGSTSLMDKHGDRLWDEHRRAHFGVLREALAAHGGTEVKNTGDGLMAVFGSVIDMVECAAAMQLTAAPTAACCGCSPCDQFEPGWPPFCNDAVGTPGGTM